MKKRRLFIFVEGNDDERFFSRIIRPLFSEEYDSVEIIMYAGMKNEKVCGFVRSIIAMGHDYILCADIDQEQNVRAKKTVLSDRYCLIENDHIIVIIKEIESWYLAGLDDRAQNRLGIRQYRSTNHITKELFNSMIPRHYASRIAFMGDILGLFSLSVAKEKNRSFSYFSQKFHLFPDERRS